MANKEVAIVLTFNISRKQQTFFLFGSLVSEAFIINAKILKYIGFLQEWRFIRIFQMIE